MADANRISVIFTAVTGPLTKGLAKAGAALQSFGAKAQMAGIKFTALLTAPILLAAKAVGQATAQFQQNMTRSTAIMGDLSDAMKSEMAQTAKDVARDVNKSSSEMAEGFFFLASAGLDAKQSIAALPAVSTFAVAGAFDLAKATSLAADAQSALGLKVKDASQNLENLTRVTDVLVKANTLANATTEQFSRALTTKAGTAIKIVNKEIEEGVAVLAAFADQGIKAENAGTALNIVFRDLKTKGLKFRGEWEKLGGVFDKNTGKMRHMADIVESLEDHIAGMSEETAHASLKALGFADKSLVFTQALIGMSGKIRDFEKNLKRAGGTTDKVAEKQLKNLADRFTIAKQRVNEMMIELGEKLTPAFEAVAVLIEDIGAKIGELAEWFETLSEAERQNVIQWVAIGAAIGPLLVLFGLFTSALGFATTAVYALATALAWLVANPIAAVVAVIGLTLIATFTDWFDSMDEAETRNKSLGEVLVTLKDRLQGATDALKKFWASKDKGRDLAKQTAVNNKLLADQHAVINRINEGTEDQIGLNELNRKIWGDAHGKTKQVTEEEWAAYKRLSDELKTQLPLLGSLMHEKERLGAASAKVAEETSNETEQGLRLDAMFAALAAGSMEVTKALEDNKREAATLAGTTDDCTIALKGMERSETALQSALKKVGPYIDLIQWYQKGTDKVLGWREALKKLKEEQGDLAPGGAPEPDRGGTAVAEAKSPFGPEQLRAVEEARLAIEALQIDLLMTGDMTEEAFNTGALEIWRGAVTASVEELQGVGVEFQHIAENPALIEAGNQVDIFKDKITEVKEETSEARKAWDDWLKAGQSVALNLTNAMTSAFDSIAQGFGDVVASAIIDGEDFGQMMKQMWNNIAKQIISTLVQIGVQWLITALLGKALDAGTHATKIGQSTSQAGAAAFAAYAGIPFIGPALGAAAATAAIAGTVAASIAGYAAGSVAGAIQLASGGIVTSPTFAMIGEAGPEAVIPLTGRNGLSARTQHINLYMDGQLVTETVLQNMPDEVRLNIGGAI